MSDIAVVVFSCARDIELARLAVSTVPAGWPVCLVIAPEDLTAFDGFPCEQRLVCQFDRGATLDGGAAILGVLNGLRMAARHLGGPAHIVKLDSDCLLFDPTFLEGDGLRGFAHHLRPGAALGLAYALPTDTLLEVEKVLTGWMRKQSPKGWGEDVAITTAAQAVLGDPFGSDHRRGFGRLHWESFNGDKPRPGYHLAGHYRSRTWLRKLGVTAEPDIIARALERMLEDLPLAAHHRAA